MDYYRLEYNERKGLLHYIPFSKRKDDLIDWETITMVIALDELKRFINSVLEKYPQVNSEKGEEFPSAHEIKELYNSFIGISEL